MRWSAQSEYHDTLPCALRCVPLPFPAGEVARFTPVSAVLRDGTELQPDIVLYATGYSNQYRCASCNFRACSVVVKAPC